jgi:hypothetical protein
MGAVELGAVELKLEGQFSEKGVAIRAVVKTGGLPPGRPGSGLLQAEGLEEGRAPGNHTAAAVDMALI